MGLIWITPSSFKQLFKLNIMKQQTIYLDTSVIGGCFDEEFAPWSKGLIKDLQLGHFKAVVSELVAAEI
jgi:hypothetical protein